METRQREYSRSTQDFSFFLSPNIKLMYPNLLSFYYLEQWVLYLFCVQHMGVYVFMCVRACRYTCMYVWVHVEARGWLQIPSSVVRHLIWGEWALSLDLELIGFPWLARSELPLPWYTGITGLCCLVGSIYTDAGDLNSHPQACLTSPLPTKPFSQHPTFVFNYLFVIH